jgi:hypothetical protein
MTKEAIISEILSLPLDDQLDIHAMLARRLGHELVLDEEQERELKRRLRRSEKDENHSRPWEEVCADLEEMVRRMSRARNG